MPVRLIMVELAVVFQDYVESIGIKAEKFHIPAVIMWAVSSFYFVPFTGFNVASPVDFLELYPAVDVRRSDANEQLFVTMFVVVV